jgi:hypothetical protein
MRGRGLAGWCGKDFSWLSVRGQLFSKSFQKKWIFSPFVAIVVLEVSNSQMNRYMPLLGVLFLPLLLIGCGEIGWDMVISSAGTYQVSAMANEVSLDSCSFVGKNSDLYPYFKNFLVNDPDVRGLVVFLRNAQGEQVSGKYHYTLIPESEEKPEPEDDAPAQEPDETPAGEAPVDEPAAVESVVTFIRVPRLDQRLPAFIIPEELPMGYYTLVFQVLGRRDVLYRTEKPIYYIADAEFELTDLQSYLPDDGGGRLPSPGDNVLLEAFINADERLTPYVVWYSGKQTIAEGYVSEGADRLMWKVPEQPLFHTIRAEVFPVMPDERSRRSITGTVKELLVPVSTKNERKKAEEADAFAHWYDFGGTLEDDNNPGDSQYDLIPLGATVPAWKPYAGFYGLALASGDQYEIPLGFAELKQNEQGLGRIKLHAAAPENGPVLDLNLNRRDSSDAVHISVSLAEAGLVLSIEAGEERYEETLAREGGEYSSILFEYKLSSQYLAVTLSLNDNAAVSREPDLSELSLAGTGTLRLGSGVAVSVPDGDGEAAIAGEKPAVVIINELWTAYDIQTVSWTPEPEPPAGETAAEIN